MNDALLKKLNVLDGEFGTRKDTDTLFKLPQGCFSYSGIFDKSIKLIEKIQGLDERYWNIFVNQFRSNVDDATLSWKCEYWGKTMRGSCMVYEYTQNEKLYKVLEKAVTSLMETQDELGRISSYSIEKEFNGWDMWGRKYVLLGFLHFASICKDNDLKEKVIECAKRHVDYIISKVGDESEGKKPITSCSQALMGLNASSILEPIVRLYNVTGEQRYLDFAHHIVSCGGISEGNIFELAYEGKLYPFQYPLQKAYEMMSNFEGLLEYYRVTKIEKYKVAVINFVNLLLESDFTIVGSSGLTHELFDNSSARQFATDNYGIMQETCVTVTLLKLLFQVLCFTGDVKYADAIEISLYNAMLGSVNTYESDMILGFPFDSYSPLFMGTRARRTGGFQGMENATEFYGCCACIGGAGIALGSLWSVVSGKDGIYFNAYESGKVCAFDNDANKVNFKVETTYPSGNKIKITLENDCNTNLFVRIPSWCEKYTLSVNGKDTENSQKGYIKVFDKAKTGDKIEIEFFMPVKLCKADVEYDENSKYLWYLKRGPLILVKDARLCKIDEICQGLCDENGIVDAKISNKADFDTICQYEIPTKDGSSFVAIDYQSAGKTWKVDSAFTCFFPTKNFWGYDETKPVRLEFHSIEDPYCFARNPKNDDVFRSLKSHKETLWNIENVGEVSNLSLSDKISPSNFMIEKCDDGFFKIRLCDTDLYITAVDEKDIGKITLKLCEDKGCDCQKWSFENFVLDFYRMTSKKFGLSVMFDFDSERYNFFLIDPTKNVNSRGFGYDNLAFIKIENV